MAAIAFVVACPAAADEYRLAPQDKIRVKAFEWRPSRDEIYEWESLNDEYNVGPSGTIMLPLVGQLEADGTTTNELSARISEQLKRNLGLKSQPDVSVEIIQYRPFYVTGQVMKSGDYPYRPGLTVLQAVAIAGGVLQSRDLGPLRLEREMITSEGDLRLQFVEWLTLSIRRSRLEAELSGSKTFQPPANLERHRSDSAFTTALRQEQAIFSARREAFDTQTAALVQLRAHVEKEIESLKEQLVLEDKQISLIKRELQTLITLVDKGLAVTSRQLAMERSVAQSESDKIKLSVSLMKGFQEISKTEIGLLEVRNKRAGDVTTELREVQGKIDTVTAKYATTQRLLNESELSAPLLLQRSRTRPVQNYTITRRTPSGGETVPAMDTDILLPGDTLTVELKLPDYNPQLRHEAAVLPPTAEASGPTLAR
ncbi:polysaccharide biosynthesis/export family protein [Methylobacterium sp. M6A4_1b]